jgi:hypothetical protein
MALEFQAESMSPVNAREKKFTIQIQNKEHLPMRHKNDDERKGGVLHDY